MKHHDIFEATRAFLGVLLEHWSIIEAWKSEYLDTTCQFQSDLVIHPLRLALIESKIIPNAD